MPQTDYSWGYLRTKALSRLATLLRRRGINAEFSDGTTATVSLVDHEGYVQVGYNHDNEQFHLLGESPDVDEFIPVPILPLLVAGLVEELSAAVALRQCPATTTRRLRPHEQPARPSRRLPRPESRAGGLRPLRRQVQGVQARADRPPVSGVAAVALLGV